jgi:hypothetical protein
MEMLNMVAYPKFGFPKHSVVFELLLQKCNFSFWDTS